MKNTKDLRNIVEQIVPKVVETRHKLHETPEQAGEEHITSAFIRETLGRLETDIRPPFINTDVVAMIQGAEKGRNVTLRADIDGLPIEEKTGLPYQSRRPGYMHACGHDGHAAVVLGAAMVLSELRHDFSGSVRLVFQPGEEVAALGKTLVERGALLNPEPDAVLAFHGWPGVKTGTIASMPGPMMAAAGLLKIVVKGKGGHSSKPDKTIDPISIAARILDDLNALPTKSFNPVDPVIISICRLTAGANANIVPDTAEMEGTFRYFNPDFTKKLPFFIERIARCACEAKGAACDFTYSTPYIPTVNDKRIVDLGRSVAQKYLGADSWTDPKYPSMGGEDFAYYIEKYPGAIFWLGMGEDSPGLHNASYDFNDDALFNGILFMTASTLKILDPDKYSG